MNRFVFLFAFYLTVLLANDLNAAEAPPLPPLGEVGNLTRTSFYPQILGKEHSVFRGPSSPDLDFTKVVSFRKPTGINSEVFNSPPRRGGAGGEETPPYSDSLKASGLIELSIKKAATDKDSSLLLFNLALSVFKENDDLRGWINACKNLGVEFDVAGDLTTALMVYKKGNRENLFRQPANREEWKSLGWLYANEGYTLHWYGKYFEAKPRYEAARQLFENEAKWVDTLVAAYVHRELGNLCTRFGDHEAALLLLEQVKKTALAYRHHNLAAEAGNDLAIVHIDMGKAPAAIKTCKEVLALPGLNVVSTALLESTLALAYSKNGQRKEALTHAEAAKKALSQVAGRQLHSSGKYWLSNLQKLMGELLDDPAEAESQLRQSLDLLRSYYPDTSRREFAKLRLSMAGVYFKNQQFEKALQQQQQALNTVLYRYQNTDPLHNPSAQDFYPENTIAEALGGKAQVFRAMYDRTKNRKFLEKSLECHDLIFEAEKVYRQVHHFESSKLAVIAESSQRTELALEDAWRFYRDFNEINALEKAFEFAEKSKSVLLYEALREAGASAVANVPPLLLQQEKQLKDEQAAVEKVLFFERQKKAAGSQPAIEQLERELLDLTAAATNLQRQIERDYPAFYELKYRHRVVNTHELQKRLEPDQALVEYFVGKHHIFIFLLKKDAFAVERVEKDFPLESWVSQFRQDIEAFQFSSGNRDILCQNYTEQARLLYQKLLQPVEKYGLPEHLLIVPGGVLGFLPFDALLYEAPAHPCIFKKYPYLVRRHTVSYSYSSTLLLELMQKRKQPAMADFAAFAPAFTEGNNLGFGALKYNMAAAAETARLAGGKALLAEAATVSAFRNFAAKSRILYLATHAQANSGEGNFSFIVLAKAGGGFDTLFVKDIYNLPLSASLVFLGACETGNGKWHNGEGIISLARSFLYAGAGSIVTTLWSINDESNKNLTLGFFRHLNKGSRKDVALRKAKLELLESASQDLYAHPVFWAAYTPIGNMEPLKGGFSWWLMVGGIGLAGLFWWGLKLRKKTRPKLNPPISAI